ncbi:unnamed protein product [Musa hybrid cultivar]
MRPRSIKQVIIQSEVQLELVRQEIRICFLAGSCHLPFKVTKERLRSHGACLSFPDHLDGTLLDVAQVMQLKQELFSWSLEVPAECSCFSWISLPWFDTQQNDDDSQFFSGGDNTNLGLLPSSH